MLGSITEVKNIYSSLIWVFTAQLGLYYNFCPTVVKIFHTSVLVPIFEESQIYKCHEMYHTGINF